MYETTLAPVPQWVYMSVNIIFFLFDITFWKLKIFSYRLRFTYFMHMLPKFMSLLWPLLKNYFPFVDRSFTFSSQRYRKEQMKRMEKLADNKWKVKVGGRNVLQYPLTLAVTLCCEYGWKNVVALWWGYTRQHSPSASIHKDIIEKIKGKQQRNEQRIKEMYLRGM